MGHERSPARDMAQQSLIPEAQGKGKRARKAKAEPEPSLIALAWRAYKAAYEAHPKYKVPPVWNRKIAGQFKLLVESLGSEAPEVATFYLGHPDYLNYGHQVGALLKDAEHLRTQWKKGQIMTRSYGRAPPSLPQPVAWEKDDILSRKTRIPTRETRKPDDDDDDSD